MITSDQFRPVEAQYALFTPGLQFSISKVMSSLGSLFDGPPVALPSGLDLPALVPRLILSSADQREKLQLSSSRVDFFVASKDSDFVDLHYAQSRAMSVISAYLDVTRATVGRLAFVLKRTAKNASPGSELARHFCKEKWLAGPLNRPEDFELHAHKKYRFAQSWDINSWMRCKTARVLPSNEPAVLIEQDLNTIAEELETADFAQPDIVRFFTLCLPEMHSILDLYFPRNHYA